MMRLEADPRRRNWLVLAILLLATGLRLVNLAGRTLWYDEAFAILYSEKSLSTILSGTIAQVNGAAADVHPLLYYDLLHFWQVVAGGSAFSVRLLSVAFGVASIALVHRVAREWFGEQVAFWAVLLAAVAPFHVNYSQEARMYSLLAFLTLIMVWCFTRAMYAKAGAATWGFWAAFAVTGALSQYTQNLAILNVVALGLWIVGLKRWRLILPFVLACLGMVLLYAPWLSLLPSQFGKVHQAYWVPRPGVGEVVRTLISFTFNLPVPNWLLPAALILSLTLFALTLYRLFRVGPLTDELKLACTLAFAPVVVMFLVSQFKSVYIERAVLPAALAYYILLAAVWAWARAPAWLTVALVLPFVAVGLVAFHTHYTWDEFPRSPYPQLVSFLRARAAPEDAIIHDNKLSFFPSYYYDRGLQQAFVPDPAGSGSDTLALPTQAALGLYATPLDIAVQGRVRVWFIIYRRAVEEYVKAGKPGHPDKIWMDSHFRLIECRSFGDLDACLYESAAGAIGPS